MTAEQIKNEIDMIYDDVVSLRRYLHMHPELSKEEQKTMEFISAKLVEKMRQLAAEVLGAQLLMGE